MIRLNVFISVNAGSMDELLDVARKLVNASQADKGCVAYDIFTSATRPGVMMICETWQDEASLAAHEATPHFITLVPRLRSLSEGMKTDRFTF